MLKVVIIESMSLFSLYMMVSCANFPPIIAWKVSSTLGFQLFGVELGYCVFWLAGSFQAKVEKHVMTERLSASNVVLPLYVVDRSEIDANSSGRFPGPFL